MDSIINNSSFGKFIALEGIDGSGKSTHARRLSEKLSSLNIKCYETREPTDSAIGALIHQIMDGRMAADNRVIASLFIADRIDHLLNATDGIYKKIESGITVITDRYYFSSYAYHGVDLDMDWVISGNSLSADILRPTVTVFLDMPVKKALERIERERRRIELFEKEDLLAKVREKYYEAFEKLRDVENITIVDADDDIDSVSEKIWRSVAKFFENV